MSNELRMHVFVCTNDREETHPRGCCNGRGSMEIMTKLKKMARNEGLKDVRVNKSGCLDRCEDGPTCVIYPEGVWYSLPSDESGLLQIMEHIKGSSPSKDHLMVIE